MEPFIQKIPLKLFDDITFQYSLFYEPTPNTQKDICYYIDIIVSGNF